MASVDSEVNHSNDRHSRLRPFAWVKRLKSLKNSSNSPSSSARKSSPSKNKKSTKRDSSSQADSTRKKASSPKSPSNPSCKDTEEFAIHENGLSHSKGDKEGELEHERGNQCPGASNGSTAPTLDTNPGTLHSEAGISKTETSGTTVGGMSNHSEGVNSIFSSSNPSSHSLTTTLTTIQSTAPSGVLNQAGGGTAGVGQQIPHHIQTSHHQHHGSQSSTYFSHQYPTTPASAVPSHLTPGSAHVPMTYRSAIANNLLTDNASILTLASSSNRRHNRRNSVDTDASVRAIAPASVWGGSRESLPLSVLSKEAESIAAGGAITPAGGTSQSRPSISGVSEQRVSVYSSGGINAPALNSERNSVYTGRSAAVSGVNSPTTPTANATTFINGGGPKEQPSGPPDGISVASIKSGVLGHVRQDSNGSPLVTSTAANGESEENNSDHHSEIEVGENEQRPDGPSHSIEP